MAKKTIFQKGNKVAEKYTEEFVNIMLEDFFNWIIGTTPVITEEGLINKENIFYFDYVRHFYESYNIQLPSVLNSIRTNKPEQYKVFQELKDILAEKMIKGAIEGKLKEVSTKFYLSARFKGWSEKLETKNENTNTSITWNEEKTYISDNQDNKDE